MKTLAIGLALAAAVPGCHAVNKWAFGDPSIHNHVSLLMSETTKYLSFAVLTGSEKENRIALWEVRP